MTPLLDIMLNFVATDAYRAPINKVLFDGAQAWATDGRILIRAPFEFQKTEDTTGIFEKMAAQIDPWLPSADSPLWSTEIPQGEIKTRRCTSCKGTGKRSRCPECEGEGAVEAKHDWNARDGRCKTSYYDVDCKTCDGDGHQSGGEEDCDYCNGTGTEELDSHVPFGSAWINARILKRLEVLPGLKIHPNIQGKPMSQIAICGDGWVGVIMPMRAPEA